MVGWVLDLLLLYTAGIMEEWMTEGNMISLALTDTSCTPTPSTRFIFKTNSSYKTLNHLTWGWQNSENWECSIFYHTGLVNSNIVFHTFSKLIPYQDQWDYFFLFCCIFAIVLLLVHVGWHRGWWRGAGGGQAASIHLLQIHRIYVSTLRTLKWNQSRNDSLRKKSIGLIIDRLNGRKAQFWFLTFPILESLSR